MIYVFLLSIFCFINVSCSQLDGSRSDRFLPKIDIVENKIDLPDEKIDLPSEKIDLPDEQINLSPRTHVKQWSDLSRKKITKNYAQYTGLELTQYNDDPLEEGEIRTIRERRSQTIRQKSTKNAYAQHKNRTLNNRSPKHSIRKKKSNPEQKLVYLNPHIFKIIQKRNKSGFSQ